jgi:hypothetical protein
VAAAMNSAVSSTCVHDASLLSRTPSAADTDNPLAQIPLKPASSTIFALIPLWPSMMNSNFREFSMRFNCEVFGSRNETGGTALDDIACAEPATSLLQKRLVRRVR